MGQLEWVNYFAELGADINTKNNLALRMAIINQRESVIKYSIFNGVNLTYLERNLTKELETLSEIEDRVLLENWMNY